MREGKRPMTQMPVPPPGSYYPQPRKSSSKALWIILGVLGFVIVGCCGGGLVLVGLGLEEGDSGKDEVKVTEGCGERGSECESDGPAGSDPPPDPQAQPGTQDNPAPRGKAVENESARYEILDVQVTDSIQYGDPPSGKYVIVTLAVTNVKNETIQFSSSDLTLIVSGTQIDADDETYLLDDGFSYDDISPGLRKTGSVVFDVAPRDAGKGVLKAQALFSMDEPVYMALR